MGRPTVDVDTCLPSKCLTSPLKVISISWSALLPRYSAVNWRWVDLAESQDSGSNKNQSSNIEEELPANNAGKCCQPVPIELTEKSPAEGTIDVEYDPCWPEISPFFGVFAWEYHCSSWSKTLFTRTCRQQRNVLPVRLMKFIQRPSSSNKLHSLHTTLLIH